MKRSTAPLFAFVLGFLLTSSGGLARADDSDGAQQFFEQSADAYNHGDFDRAVRLLTRAYALQPDPVLFYNLARAYEGLGDLPDALRCYEQYAEAQPHAVDAGAVRTRIVALRKQIDERAALATLARTSSAPRVEGPSVVPWIVAGTGVASALAGTIFGILAASRHDAALSERSQATAQHDQSTAQTFGTAANITWIAGGALAAAGIIWVLLDARTSKPTSANVARHP